MITLDTDNHISRESFKQWNTIERLRLYQQTAKIKDKCKFNNICNIIGRLDNKIHNGTYNAPLSKRRLKNINKKIKDLDQEILWAILS